MPHRSSHHRPAAEQAFLAEYDASRYPHPSVAVDVVVLTVSEGALHALLIRRGDHPHKHRWSLPGTFVGISESLDDAADRVLTGKASLPGVFLEQLYTFGAVHRDPRTRVISVAYIGLLEIDRLRRALGELESPVLARLRVPWAGESGGPIEAVGPSDDSLPLAFDHADILGMSVKRLRGKIDYAPLAYEFLPAEFSLRMLQDVHEAILGRTLNKDAFRRRLLASGDLTPTGRLQTDVGHRPAEFYRYGHTRRSRST